MKRTLSLLTCLWLAGCASVAPGNDPLVVNVERTETVAKATFEALLTVDHADRAFWRAEAPAFHAFCEALRTPQAYQVTNTVPKWAALLLDLNDTKHDYIAARTSSNTLAAALSAVQSTLNRAAAWYQIVTEKGNQ